MVERKYLVNDTVSLGNKENMFRVPYGITFLPSECGAGKTYYLCRLYDYLLNNNIKTVLINYRQLMLSEEQRVASCENSEVVLLDNIELYCTDEFINRVKSIPTVKAIMLAGHIFIKYKQAATIMHVDYTKNGVKLYEDNI